MLTKNIQVRTISFILLLLAIKEAGSALTFSGSNPVTATTAGNEWGGSTNTLCTVYTFQWFTSGSAPTYTFTNIGGNYTDFVFSGYIWIYTNGLSETVTINFNGYSTTLTPGGFYCGSGWYRRTLSFSYQAPCNTDQMTISFTTNTFFGIESLSWTQLNRCAAQYGCRCCLVANATYCTACFDTKYYLDTIINGCYPCDLTCRSCTQSSSEICTSCWSKTLWYMGGSRTSCVNTCGTNTYYYGGSAPYCRNCTDVNCATCAPETICTRCNDGYFLTGTTCTPCNSNCATCTGTAINCLTCKTNMFLLGTVCVNSCGTNYRNNSGVCQACLQPVCLTCPAAVGTCTSCPTSYYVDVSGVCQPCAWANCLQCTSTTCLKCDSGNNWFWDPVNMVCTNTCPNYYNYKNTVNGTCDRCTDTRCLTCPAAASTCTSCEVTYFVTGSNACASCLANCDVCPDTTSCTTCTAGYSKQAGTPDVCQGVCNTGYMSSGGNCIACTDANCLACPASNAICTSCNTSYYWLNGAICSTCISNCLYCTTGTTCAYCNVGYYYDASTMTPVCGLTCPNYYRNNSATRLCERCSDPNCMKCDNSLTNCTQCSVTWYAHPTTRDCQACSSLCDYCNTTGCITCTSGNYLMPDLTCIPVCPTGYMTNSTSCLKCQDVNCLACPANTSICTSCPTDYFYINSTNQCDRCLANCINCVDGVTCSFCDFGYYYLSPPGQCIPVCPTGYYTNTISRTCDPCVSGNCTSCPLSAAICTACVQWTHYLTGGLTCPTCSGACLNCTQTGFCLECDLGYYIHSSGACRPCPANCLRCDSTGVRCTQCIPDYYLFLGNSSCVSSCRAPLWKNDVDRSCALCTTPGCIFCPVDPNVCQKCNGLTYLNGTKCQTCPSQCITCTSATECTECAAKFYLSGTSCVKECPSGTSSDQYRHCITDIVDSYASGNASRKAVVASDVCTGILMGTGLPSAALGLGGPTMWSAFGSLQIVGMFNALDVILPSNVRVFLGGLTTAHFSFLPSTITKKSEEKYSTRTLQQTTTQDIGISEPPIYNSGDVFLTKGFPLLVVLITTYCLLLALIFLTWCNAFHSARKLMEWNGVIRISILLYLPLVTYSFLQISNGANSSDESTSLALCFLGLVYCIGFFIWVAKILKKDIPDLYSKEMEAKYGTLYSNHEAHSSKFAKYYCLIMLIRSTLQGLFVAFMKSAPSVQLVFLLIIDLVLMYKMLAERVFSKKTDRQLLALQQGCIIFSEVCMLVFASVNLSYSAGNVIGWAFIVVVLMTLIINMLRVLYLLFICIFKTQSPKKVEKRTDRIRIVPFAVEKSHTKHQIILSRTPTARSEISA